MASPKDIHKLQQNHFAQPDKTWTDHYSTDDKELDKYLDKVGKEFMKVERENASKNREAYVASKLNKKRDELFVIHKEKGEK